MTDRPHRVLVVGGDGAIGRHLTATLRARGFAVTATTRRGGGDAVFADLADPGFDAADLPAAEFVIICAAMARFADCRAQPELARRVNVEAPARIAERFAAERARVVLLSTSAVFDCRSPHAAADLSPAPRSEYGTLKAEAEAAVLASGGAASVLRLTKVLSRETALIQGWIAALRRGERVTAFADMTIAPIGLADVESAVAAAMEDGGIVQVSARDDISYADIARHLAGRLGRSLNIVEAVDAATAGIPAAEVTRFTSLDTSRLEAISTWRPSLSLDVVDRVFAAELAAPDR